MSPTEFEQRLMSLDPDAVEFPLWIDQFIVSVPETLQARLIPAMFKYFEMNPTFDNGAPGAMVHFIEDYYPSYKTMLLESLAKKPSQMCVLMVNRILNSKLEPEERAEYIAVLEEVRNDSNALASVRDEAAHIIKYQERKAR